MANRIQGHPWSVLALTVLLPLLMLTGAACSIEINSSDPNTPDKARAGSDGSSENPADPEKQGSDEGSSANENSERADTSADRGSPSPVRQEASSRGTGVGNGPKGSTSEGEDPVAVAKGALGQLTETSDPQVADQPPTMSGTQGQTLDGFMQTVAADVDSFWVQNFGSWNSSASQEQYGASQEQYGASQVPETVSAANQFSYESPSLTVFSGSTDAGPCEQVTQSLYCPVEGAQGVYIERSEAQDAYEQTGDTDGADFAVAFLVAHEYAHHVQAELGYFDPNNPVLVQSFEERSVPFENQADCLAGVWSYYAGYREMLEEDDIGEAMIHAATIGDTRTKLERSHGTPDERRAWFNEGYTTGDSSRCAGNELSP